MQEKKGLSPLIATIILIALSVGLGLLVMGWGRAYIEEKAEFVQGVQEILLSCNAVSFSVISVAGAPQMCIEGSIVKGALDNGPNVRLHDIQARIAGSKGVYVQESLLPEPLERSSAAQFAFAVPSTIGDILQVRLTPKIEEGKEILFCAQQSVTVEPVPRC